MAANLIYLDYNATAPLLPVAQDAMLSILALPVNASSVHQTGRRARAALEQARASIAESVSAFPAEIIFTASATEANNWALRAFPERPLFVAATEHASVLQARADAQVIPVDSEGRITPSMLQKVLQGAGKPAIVSIMLANNETGVIQPIPQLAQICHDFGALLHCDAVQGIGRIQVDCGILGADLFTISSHKCGGPVGAGALIARGSTALAPLLKGGGQELNRRAGTENVAAIAGMAAAISYAIEHLDRVQLLQDHLREYETLLLSAAPGVRVAGQDAERLPNTMCVTMPNVSNEVQLMYFDLAGICISAGAACTSGRIEPSHVLTAMGWSAEEAGQAIRVSLGWNSSEQDLKMFVNSWLNLYSRQGGLNAAEG